MKKIRVLTKPWPLFYCKASDNDGVYIFLFASYEDAQKKATTLIYSGFKNVTAERVEDLSTESGEKVWLNAGGNL